MKLPKKILETFRQFGSAGGRKAAEDREATARRCAKARAAKAAKRKG